MEPTRQEIVTARGSFATYPASLQIRIRDSKLKVVSDIPRWQVHVELLNQSAKITGGIEQFHYAPNGDAYNLFFEQPTFLFDFGIREIVMYNKLDEHLIMSHAAWILTGASEELEARQGWHTVHNASSPHWKYFWFD